MEHTKAPVNGRPNEIEALRQVVTNLKAMTTNFQNLLAPRIGGYGGQDLLDPRRNIAYECGWPLNPTTHTYGELYERDGVARRVVNVYPDECWGVSPELYEADDEDVTTPFEAAWEEFAFRLAPWHFLERLDVLSGIGTFGVLLLGFDDGADLDKPVRGMKLDGTPRANAAETRVEYMRVFDESSVRVGSFDPDPRSPRYGQPQDYEMNFADPNALAAGEPFQGENRTVHWSRVLHAADDRRGSEVFGTPRLKPVLNRIADLRKVLGGSAEMFWQGAFPGYSIETLPEIVDDAELDLAAIKEQLKDYMNGLQRWMSLSGMTARSLAPQVADPTMHVDVQLRALCAAIKVPLKVFLGSEQGHQAGIEDRVNWNRRVGKRQRGYLDPMLARPFVLRLVAAGALPPPDSKRFYLDWADLNAVGDKDKADISMKKAQALLEYVTGGVETVMAPLYFLTEVMGLSRSRAAAVIAGSAANTKPSTKVVWQSKKAVAPGAATSRPARNAQGGPA